MHITCYAYGCRCSNLDITRGIVNGLIWGQSDLLCIAAFSSDRGLALMRKVGNQILKLTCQYLASLKACMEHPAVYTNCMLHH